MYTYIHKNINNYVPCEKALDAKNNVIATDWNGYLNGGWLLLSVDQLTFKDANPTASKQEVFNMTLNPVIAPEPQKPTREEKTMQLMAMILPTSINTIGMDNNTALYYQEFHPYWATFINSSLNKGDRVQHNNGKLYRVRQDIEVVLENQQPGTVGMGALYEEINQVNAGTIDDPILYDPVAGMELKEGLHYIQDNVIYRCVRASEIALHHDLSILIGNYVLVVENLQN